MESLVAILLITELRFSIWLFLRTILLTLIRTFGFPNGHGSMHDCLPFSLSWVVAMASVIVNPSFSFMVFVNLVFCLRLDRFPNNIPANKLFFMYLCLIMRPSNWSFYYSIWLTSPLNSPTSLKENCKDKTTFWYMKDSMIKCR